MSWTWGADTDEAPIDPGHSLSCAVWTTNDQPCDCREGADRSPVLPAPRRMTLAERLDLIDAHLPCDDGTEAAS